jgi:hypothetical protein
MTRRRLIASLAVFVTLATLAILGIGRADADRSGPAPASYLACATGEIASTAFTTDPSGGFRLHLTGTVQPCADAAASDASDPRHFAYELRFYDTTSRVAYRGGYASWTAPTAFDVTLSVPGQTRAVCLTYGRGAGMRLECVQLGRADPAGVRTAEPLPTNDPMLTVPEQKVVQSNGQDPDHECGGCV